MSHYSYRSSKPDAWSSPRPYTDASLRALAYGPIRPMHEPTWLERLFGKY